MLEVMNPAATMIMSEEVKQAMEMLRETMNLVHYIYGADFRDFAELHKTGAKEELAESVDLRLCDHP